MALDPGEHDPAEVGLEQPMGLGNGVIEFGAFFEFIAVHVRLVEEFGGSLGAFAADGVQFKNESGRPANREFNVRSCCILHATILALQMGYAIQRATDSVVGIRLTLHYTLNLKSSTSPSLTTYSFPSMR